MGFYGNIRNTTSNSFKFDRIYSNRTIMEQNANTDSVFGGRYVLVEYDQPLNENPVEAVKTVYNKNGKYYAKAEILSAYKTKDDGDNLSDLCYYLYLSEEFNDIKEEVNWESGNYSKVIYEMTPTIAYRAKEADEHGDHLIKTIDWENEEGIVLYTKDQITQEITEIPVYCYVQESDIYSSSNENDIYSKPYHYIDALRNRWFLYGKEGEEIGLPWNSDNVVETEDAYTTNFAIDKAVYGLGRGYDSTVWRKVYGNDGKAKYVNIAELNSVVPTFALTSDSPSDVPRTLHFDKDSTNVYYNLHMQTPWGFMIADVDELKEDIPHLDGKTDVGLLELKRTELDTQHKINESTIKSYNGAIYFNKIGFSRDNSVYSGVGKDKNVIQIDNYQSGTKYANQDEDSTTNFENKPYDDMKGLSVILPALGDTVAEMWDIIYGVSGYEPILEEDFDANESYYEKLDPNEEKYIEYKGEEFKSGLYKQTNKRKTLHAWEDANDILTAHNEKQHLVHYTREDDYTEYVPEEGDSLVGTINSAHDLMGMIITNEDIPTTDDYADPQKAHTWQIYYATKDYNALNEDGEPADKNIQQGHYYYVSKSVGFKEIPYTELETLTAEQFKENYETGNDNYFEVMANKMPDNVYSNEINGNIYKRVNGSGIASEGWKYYTLPSTLKYVGSASKINKNEIYYLEKTEIPTGYTDAQEPSAPKHFYEAHNGEYLINQWKQGAQIADKWYELLDFHEVSGYMLDNERWYVLKADKNADPNRNNYIKLSEVKIGTDNLWVKYSNGDIKSADEFKEALRNATNSSEINLNEPIQVHYYYEHAPELSPEGETVTSEFGHIDLNRILFNNRSYYKDYGTEGKIELGWPLYYNHDPSESHYATATKKKVTLPTTGCYYADFRHPEDDPLKARALAIEAGEDVSEEFNLSTIDEQNNPIISFNRVSLREEDLDFNGVSEEYTYWQIKDQPNWGKLEDESFVGFGLTSNFDVDNEYITAGKNGYYTEFTLYYKDGNKYMPADRPDFSTGQLPMNLYVAGNEYYIIDVDESVEDDFTKYQKLNTQIILEDSDIEKYFGGENPKLKIGIKQDSKVFKELNDFARNINTLHGLLLRINEVLQSGNTRTRDNNTVQGCLNQLHDIIDGFEQPLIPGQLYGVNEYGKLGPVALNSENDNGESWVSLTPSFDEETGQMILDIVHDNVNDFDGENSTHLPLSEDADRNDELSGYVDALKDTLEADEANNDRAHDPFGFVPDDATGNRIVLHSPVIDNAGHVIGEKETTVKVADILLETNGSATIGTLTSPSGNVSITSADTVRDAFNKLITHINAGANNITLNDYDNYYINDINESMGDNVDDNDNLTEAIAKLQWQLDHIANRPLTDLDSPSNRGSNTPIAATDTLGQGLNKLQAQINNINNQTIEGGGNESGIINNYCGIIRSDPDHIPTNLTTGLGSNEMSVPDVKSGWIWVCHSDAVAESGTQGESNYVAPQPEKNYIYIKTKNGVKTGSFTDNIDRNYWELLNAWQ